MNNLMRTVVDELCNMILFLLLLLIVMPKGVWCQTLTVKPTDTVVLRGSSATFHCNSTAGTGIRSFTWIRNATDSTTAVTIVSNNCQVVAAFTSQYSIVGDPALGQCSLRVINATADLVAKYRCNDGNEASPEAALVILDSQPTGSQSPVNLFAGDRLTVSCWVTFTGSIAPWFTWTSTVTNVTASNTFNVINSTGYIAVPSTPATVINPATCTVQFPAGTVYTSYTWSSATVNVQYCPIVTISPTPAAGAQPIDVFTGEVLVCSASAHPAATSYYWFNDTGSRLANGTQLQRRDKGIYTVTCIAFNNIISSAGVQWQCNGTKSIKLNVSAPMLTTQSATSIPPPAYTTVQSGSQTTPAPVFSTTPPLPDKKTTETLSCVENLGCIVPAVVVPVVVVLIAVIVIICFCCPSCPGYKKCKKDRSASKQQSSSGRYEANFASNVDNPVMTSPYYESLDVPLQTQEVYQELNTGIAAR